MKWITKLFKPRTQNTHAIVYDKNDIERLFDELEEIAVKKGRIASYLELLVVRKEEYSVYNELKEDDVNKLMLMLNQYKAIEDKKQNLRGRLIKTNRGLARLDTYEKQLPEMMKEIAQVEKRVKDYERDLFYLDEEKKDLEEEREILVNGYKYLRYSIIAVMMFGVMGIILVIAALQIIREDVWLYLSGGLITFVIIFAGIFYAKQRIEDNLRDNAILQQKAVKFLNKTKIHYVHNKKYLTFMLDKLGVDSSATLEIYYNRYVKSKQNQEEYTKLNRQLMAIEIDVDDLFKEKDVELKDIESLREWLFSGKKNKVFEQTLEEEKKLNIQLEAFSTYEEGLWKEIYSLKEDEAYASIIEEKIEQYKILTKDNLDKKL